MYSEKRIATLRKELKLYTTAEILDALRMEFLKELDRNIKHRYASFVKEDIEYQKMMIKEFERLIELDSPGYLEEQEQSLIDQMYHL